MSFQSKVPGSALKDSKVMLNWRGESTGAGLLPTTMLLMCT